MFEFPLIFLVDVMSRTNRIECVLRSHHKALNSSIHPLNDHSSCSIAHHEYFIRRRVIALDEISSCEKNVIVYLLDYPCVYSVHCTVCRCTVWNMYVSLIEPSSDGAAACSEI